MLQVVSVYKIVYVKQLVFQRWEFWRLFTSFFYGGTGFGFLIGMMMLYRNSNSLEESRYSRRSYDYGWQLLLCSFAIYLLNIPFSAFIHHRQLLICLTYISCAMDPEGLTSVFGIITMRQKYFPYALVGLDIMDGGGLTSAARSFTGIVVGQAWFAFEHSPERRQARTEAASGSTLGRRSAGGVNILYSIWDRISQAPGWFRGLVGTGENIEQQASRSDRRQFGSAQAPRGRTVNDNGPRPEANTTGYNWGQGNRLGSD